VQPLATLLRDHAVAGAGSGAGEPAAHQPDVAVVCGVCRLLHVLVTVRGHKTVVRFFPHEAADLERALHALLAVRESAESGAAAAAAAKAAAAHAPTAAATAAAGSIEDGALAAWEAQSVLLLWLSILILTPFDLRTVDSAVGVEGGGGEGEVTPLAARIVCVCEGYLDHPGAC